MATLKKRVKSKRSAVRNPKSAYAVIVGNVGTVYSGSSLKEAKRLYKMYVQKSVDGDGRAGGESVSLLDEKVGEMLMEHFGENSEDDGEWDD